MMLSDSCEFPHINRVSIFLEGAMDQNDELSCHSRASADDNRETWLGAVIGDLQIEILYGNFTSHPGVITIVISIESGTLL